MKLEAGKDMNIVGHLTELRNRIIVTLVFFLLFFVLGFVYVEEIYSFFVNDASVELMVISPAEIIWIYFSMAGIVGISGTLPILAYQIWAFIKPGLTKKERKVSLSYIPFIFLLFITGLTFGYFVFVQFILPFLLSLTGDMFQIMFTVDRYFKFLFRITLPCALLFELPVITLFLTALGIITPDLMIKNRKYAYLILLIISTMLTPPDFISPILISIPLIILYEISIFLAKRLYLKKQADYEKTMSGAS